MHFVCILHFKEGRPRHGQLEAYIQGHRTPKTNTML